MPDSSSNAFLSAFFSTKSVPAILSSVPSLYFIVAVPSSPTTISVPSASVLLPFSSLLASSIAFLTAFFSSAVNFLGLSTFHLAGVFGFVLSARVLALSCASSDGFSDLSLAVAFTSVPALVNPSSSVIVPVFSSIEAPSTFLSSFHLPLSSFVAETTWSLPFLSLKEIASVLVSLSLGGVTVTFPSSFASMLGFAGPVVSGALTVLSFDGIAVFPLPNLVIALIGSPSFAFPFVIVTAPVLASISKPFVPSGSFHSPFSSFSAVTFTGVSEPLGV